MTSTTATWEHLFPATLAGMEPDERVLFVDDDQDSQRTVTWLSPDQITVTHQFVKGLSRRRYYQPLSNGFNLELANHVYDLIQEYGTPLWDQESWRQIIRDIDVPPSSMKKLMELVIQPETEHTCGTAMCCAGWIGESTGVDWVVDASAPALKAYRHQLNNRSIDPSEMVLVRRNEPGIEMRYDYSVSRQGWPEEFSKDLRDSLKARGFTPRTHAVMTIGVYAEVLLGLINGDWLNLFNGGNQMRDLRLIIDLYAYAGSRSLRGAELDDDSVLRRYYEADTDDDFREMFAQVHQKEPQGTLLEEARLAASRVEQRNPGLNLEEYFPDGMGR